MTHLPNGAALKMDGAEACRRGGAGGEDSILRRVGGRGGRAEAQAAARRGTAAGADLGGSSKYSSASLED